MHCTYLDLREDSHNWSANSQPLHLIRRLDCGKEGFQLVLKRIGFSNVKLALRELSYAMMKALGFYEVTRIRRLAIIIG